MKTRFLLIGVSVVMGLFGAGAGLRPAALMGGSHAPRPNAADQTRFAVHPTSTPKTIRPEADIAAHVRARQTLLSLPLQFIPNAGQTDADAEFTVRSLGGALFFTPDEVVFALPGGEDERGREVNPVVRLQLLGANPHPTLEGQAQMSGVANYFLGNDPAQWRSNVPTYGAVAYHDVYPGIDLVFRGTEGQLKTEFLLAPGADPNLIRMTYSGVTNMHLRDDGALVLETPGGELIDEAPIAYQEILGQHISVTAQFRLLEDPAREASGATSDLQPPTTGFALGDYDPAYPLVVDPVLVFSTYLGGSGGSAGFGVAVDSTGNIYVAGGTSSTDFPIRNAVQDEHGGGYQPDAFVIQIVNASGAYTYGFSTYLGGSGFDFAQAVAADDSGNVYVTGFITSTDFPMRNAISTTLGGELDAFVTQIISASDVYTLGYSTYLGGKNSDLGWDIVVDPMGNVYVTGETASADFPLWRPISNTLSGSGDAFVTQLISEGGVITYGYSTYLGGSGAERGTGVAVDNAGNVYLTGVTYSTDFPIRNAISDALLGQSDAFVTSIVSTTGVITYGFSTYVGGSASDYGFDIVADNVGSIYIGGGTSSTDFPTRNAIQGTFGGGVDDVIVTQIISAGGVLTYGYSTYIGGSGLDEGLRIAVDSAGNVYATGVTTSTNFPTWAAILDTYSGGAHDAFATKIISTGGIITYGYSTYLGGASDDQAIGVAVDRNGNAYVTGYTASSNFPTTQNSISDTLSGTGAAFVTVIAAEWKLYLPLMMK